MRPRASAWMVVAAAALAGCAIGPDYKRPAVPQPETFRGEAAANAASLADAPWWEVFEDPILKYLIQESFRANYDVKIAAARVQEARGQLGIARSELFPSLDYGVGAGRGNSISGPGGIAFKAPGGTTDVYSATMAASWEIDIWGRVRRSNEAALAALLASEDAQRGVWLTLVSDVAQAYFELLALDVQLQIARDSTDSFQRTYNLFLDRLQQGAASKLETARALGALGRAQALVPQLESQIVAKENQISILLGNVPIAIPR